MVRPSKFKRLFAIASNSKRVWSTKKISIPLQLHHLISLSRNQWKRLSVKDLKELVHQRVSRKLVPDSLAQQSKHLLEKQDYIAFLVRSWPNLMAPHLPLKPNGDEWYEEEMQLGFRSEWTGIWKQNYAVTLQDAKRTWISQYELVTLDWEFYFTFPEDELESLPEDHFLRQNRFWAKFRPNLSFESNIQIPGQPMESLTWIFLHFPRIPSHMRQLAEDFHVWPELDEQNLEDVHHYLESLEVEMERRPQIAGLHDPADAACPHLKPLNRLVQVGRYPPLVVRRHAETWQWILTNSYVAFENK
jgi:hypothetical protein